MTSQKMILFDYGGTLMYEPDFNPRCGNEALFRLIKDNPNNVTLDEFTDYLTRLFDEIRALRGEYIEIHEHHFLKYLIDYFGITLTVPVEYAEMEMFNAITHPVITPGADSMLAYLRSHNIRTGVISNLCWSGEALSTRLCKSFPEHQFDFIMTSSDYIFRKPDKHIFELAVRKSGLSAEDIWYCGNDLAVDVVGAHHAGLFPVFYDDRTVPGVIHEKNDKYTIDVPHLHISNWGELTAELDRLIKGR